MSRDDQLYVKLDGQNDIEEELNSVQGTIANVNEALEVLREVRTVRENAISKIYENISHLDDSVKRLEGQLPGVDNSHTIKDDVQPAEIDGSVQELHSELETLQNELERLG